MSVSSLDLHLVPDVDKNAVIAHLDQCELAEVGVRREVFQSVELMASLMSMGKTMTMKVTNRLAEKAV